MRVYLEVSPIRANEVYSQISVDKIAALMLNSSLREHLYLKGGEAAVIFWSHHFLPLLEMSNHCIYSTVNA